MSPSPEERASAALSSLGDEAPTNGALLAAIAQAIRQAENDKLEEAAAVANSLSLARCLGDKGGSYVTAMGHAASRIRALKKD